MSINVSSIYGNAQNQYRPDPAQMKVKVDAMLVAAGATQEEIDTAGPQGIRSLASKYGVSLPQPPQMQQGNIFENQNKTNGKGNQMKAQVDAALIENGATKAEISEAAAQGPEGIKALAEKYGVELPQPPQPPEGASNQGNKPSGPPQEIINALTAGGATEDEIASIDGPDAAKTLADKYDVTLPSPPQKRGSASSSSTSSIDTSSMLQQIMSFLQSLGFNISQ